MVSRQYTKREHSFKSLTMYMKDTFSVHCILEWYHCRELVFNLYHTCSNIFIIVRELCRIDFDLLFTLSKVMTNIYIWVWYNFYSKLFEKVLLISCNRWEIFQLIIRIFDGAFVHIYLFKLYNFSIFFFSFNKFLNFKK